MWNHGYDTLLAQTKLHEAKVLTAAKMRVTLHEENMEKVFYATIQSMEYYTKLKIVVEQSGGVELSSTNAVTTVWETDMDGCNIHAWFTLFAGVLGSLGFSEINIMKGGCELAFNDMRSIADMKKVAEEYDLTMNELAPESEESTL